MSGWMGRNGLYVLGLVVALFAGMWWTPHLFHESSCLLVQVLPAKAPGPDKLQVCSPIEQSVLMPLADNVRDTEADSKGWRIFTSAGGAARLKILVKKASGSYVFYPRLGGAASAISILEVIGKQRRLLYYERGKDTGWTPVARRMLLRADCVRNGWSEEEFPIELEVLLEGPSAQLWHKDGLVFY